MSEKTRPPWIPDYELLLLVGSGSYGDVWLARGVTGLYRAIKIVRRERFLDEDPYEREFNGLREFAAISLATPNQLALLHIGRNDISEFFYYVMELADDVNGGARIDPEKYVPRTLQVLRKMEGRMPVLQVVSLGADLARALAGLHDRGLVHCDIKPSNVIFVGGSPKLADIGLVSAANSAGVFVGTEGFVAPEGPGDPAADVYSLGKLLYEAATGLDRREFPRLPENLGEFGDRRRFLELNEVIVRACDPKPARRYADARALLADLERLQELRPTLASMPRRQQPLRIASLLAIAAILSGALAFERMRDRRVVVPPAPVELGDFTEIAQASGAPVERVRFAPGDRTLLYISADHRLAVWDRSRNQTKRVVEGVELLSGFTRSGDWFYATDTDGRTHLQSAMGEKKLSWGRRPDITWHLFFDYEAGYQWIVEDGPYPGIRSMGALAPNGGEFITLADNVYGKNRQATIVLSAGARNSSDAVVVTATGSRAQYWKLHFVDIVGRRVVRIDDLPAKPSAIAISPDGGLVAIAYQETGEVEMRTFYEGRTVWRRTFDSARPRALAVSRDRTCLAVGGEALVYLVETADGALRRVLRGQTGSISDLDWSNDGRALASGSTTGDVRVWHESDGVESK